MFQIRTQNYLKHLESIAFGNVQLILTTTQNENLYV